MTRRIDEDMDTLTMGLQALRISQFFSEVRDINEDDRRRLIAGAEFIRRIQSAEVYLRDGTAEGLEACALTEARYARRTVSQLHAAKDYTAFWKHLDLLADALKRSSSGAAVSRVERQALEKFFGVIGDAMVSEVIDEPTADPEQLSPQHL